LQILWPFWGLLFENLRQFLKSSGHPDFNPIEARAATAAQSANFAMAVSNGRKILIKLNTRVFLFDIVESKLECLSMESFSNLSYICEQG
jgi:hypothetical protein